MQVPWSKYPKIPEVVSSTSAKRGCDEYIVTEKMHGANFSVITDGTTVAFAKRTAVLGRVDGCENFYSVRSTRLVHELAALALRLAANKAAAAAGVNDEIHIYGELIGGHYPHPEVSPVVGLEPVQRGVWYSPRLNFVAFDVRIRGQFLDYDEARVLCEGAGFNFVAPIFRGTLAECNAFENRFDSTLPTQLFDLPPLSEPNWAEGIVIRPAREPSSAENNDRGMYKRKIPEFAEDRRYHNPDWKTGKSGMKCVGWAEPSELELVRIEVVSRVTEQRLSAVLSKIGRVDPTDSTACRMLLRALKEDIRESLTEEERAILVDSTALKAELDSLCRELIASELRPLLK